MRRLYEAADRIEAQRLVDLLSEHKIPAVLLGDYLAGAAGELPANIFPAVWIVENGHWFRAEMVLEEFLSPDASADTPWQCANCGETVEEGFQVCWNCGMGRPEKTA